MTVHLQDGRHMDIVGIPGAAGGMANSFIAFSPHKPPVLHPEADVRHARDLLGVCHEDHALAPLVSKADENIQHNLPVFRIPPLVICEILNS